MNDSIYACDQCPKRYNRKQNLVRHRQIHLNQSYTCDNCSKKFTSAFNLKRHMDRHLQIIIYTCKFCNNQYKQLRSLKLHERTHVRQQPPKNDNFTQIANTLQQEAQQTTNSNEQYYNQQIDSYCCGGPDYEPEICESCLDDKAYCPYDT